jgi:hypothetical protein
MVPGRKISFSKRVFGGISPDEIWRSLNEREPGEEERVLVEWPESEASLKTFLQRFGSVSDAIDFINGNFEYERLKRLDRLKEITRNLPSFMSEFKASHSI